MIGLAMVMAFALPVQGARPTERCSAPTALPAELTGWSAMAPVTASAEARGAPTVAPSRALRVKLSTNEKLRFARPPVKAGAAATSGGMIAVTVEAAGRYRIALGENAWIDVIAGTTAIESVAHSHGPVCSPIRKMVDFDLAPGRYLIQLAGSRSATLPLMIVRVRK